MINKKQVSIRNTKKVLRKAGKNWITVSVVLLGLIGLGSAAGMTTHADTTTPAQTNVVKPAVNNTNSSAKVNASSTTNPWKQYHSKMFVANNGYGIYRDNWQKAGNTTRQFHHTFKVNGAWNHGKQTYYKLYNGKHYVGYTNSHAMVKTNQSTYLNVPYVSQWRPISAPEGCAEASLTMLLRYDHKHVSLPYIFSHLPQAYQMKGGQVGNAFGTDHFGHVIKHYALTKYAHEWDKNVKDISGSSVNQIKKYVQSGHPVLFYGYSSYQLPGDPNRNHCKVITAYHNGYFRVYDPLYYSKYGQAGTQGRNMMFDRGAVSWYSMKRFALEYAHMSGSNRKCALTVMGKPHYEHFAKATKKHAARRARRVSRKTNRRRAARNKATKSEYPSLKKYTSAERALANKKFNYSANVGKQTKTGRETMAADKNINHNEPFGRTNYEEEYLYALSHPALINGAQDHLGGMMTGIKDGLNDFGQYADVTAAKRYAKQHHESSRWLRNNLVENNKHGFYFWYFNGFNDNNGGDASNAAKAAGHKVGLTAYREGLHESVKAAKHSKPSRNMIKFTMNHLSNTMLSQAFQRLF